jgi:enoyl-CoA hydratase/3-hydroxyacyl-CoA dehydrogenase
MAQSYSDSAGFTLPSLLAEQVASGEDFMFKHVDAKISDGIATVRLNRPEAMNALNEDLVEQLDTLMDTLNRDDSVNTIVLEGAGKAFVAGADVKFFVDKIRADSFNDIYEFTARGHEVLSKLENSPKTTIALTTGLALGGGLELALACDHRIGTRRTQFRFPETSIGIYPGLGGTQRPARICGIPAARWAVLAGNFMDAKTATDLGLVTHLVEPAEVSSLITTLGKPDNKYPGKPANPSSKVVEFAEGFFADDNLPNLLSGRCPEGFDVEDKNVMRQIRALSRTAPIALRMASDLIDRSEETLVSGLKAELEGLEVIFGTNDALEGLSALIENRRPNFTDS